MRPQATKLLGKTTHSVVEAMFPKSNGPGYEGTARTTTVPVAFDVIWLNKLCLSNGRAVTKLLLKRLSSGGGPWGRRPHGALKMLLLLVRADLHM